MAEVDQKELDIQGLTRRGQVTMSIAESVVGCITEVVMAVQSS